LEIVFAKPEAIDFRRRVPTKGGHGGPPLQYVPNGLIQYLADNGGKGVVLQRLVAWELAVKVAAENGVTRQIFEDVLAKQ